jgi:uncharacterized protein (TIGR02246 family)
MDDWRKQPMTHTRGKLVLALLAVLAAGSAAPSQEKPTEADAKAIGKSSEALAAALSAKDAKAAAAVFTPSGEFMDGDGNVFHGRAAIEAEFDALFKANPKGHVEIRPAELRSVAAGVVIEEGLAIVGPDDQ